MHNLHTGGTQELLEEMAQYDIQIMHHPGKKHLNADSLSRMPDKMTECDCYQAGAVPA
jgi:hypothetical protein